MPYVKSLATFVKGEISGNSNNGTTSSTVTDLTNTCWLINIHPTMNPFDTTSGQVYKNYNAAFETYNSYTSPGT